MPLRCTRVNLVGRQTLCTAVTPYTRQEGCKQDAMTDAKNEGRQAWRQYRNEDGGTAWYHEARASGHASSRKGIMQYVLQSLLHERSQSLLQDEGLRFRAGPKEVILSSNSLVQRG